MYFHEQAQAEMAEDRARHGKAPYTSSSSTSRGPANDGRPAALGIPKILWEGGYLWKFPYNTSGMPKKKWVQIKSVAVKGGQAYVHTPVTLLWFDVDKVKKEESAHQIVKSAHMV